MADIKLIVKIDADVYTRLFDNGIQDNEIAVDDVCEMARALRLGTPLTDKVRESNLFLTKCSAEDITTQIDKSNFSKEQYNADLQCAYDCGKASVQPKREKGEWIPIGYDGFADGNPVYDVWECSCCKEERYGDDESLPNFCPDCGADMRGQLNGR